jgi:DNA-binding protein Fis
MITWSASPIRFMKPEIRSPEHRALLSRGGYSIHGTATCANSKALCDERCLSRRGTQSRRVMIANAGSGAKNEQSLAGLVEESLARVQRGEAVEVYAELVGTLERELFAQTMKLASGNQLRAARWLGVSGLTLRHRLQKIGLASDKYSGA